MKRLDIFIIRFLPFILFVITGINIFCCATGIDVRDSYALHSHSVIYALALFLISLSNSHYHCIWNRAMYIYLIVVPTLNYLDKKFDFFPLDNTTIVIVAALYIITAIITAYLAIRHFAQGAIKRYKKGAQ